MAEQFAKSWLAQNNLSAQYKVVSRALTDRYEAPNSAASSQAVQVLADEFSLDLSSHRSALLTAKDVDDAKFIIGVTKLHVETIKRMFPAAAGKVYNFDADVPDPWHAPVDVYHACAVKLEPLVYRSLDQLLV